MVALPLPLIAFGFGILSVLSPCILPLIPLIAAYSTRTSKITTLTMAIGLSISFALMGVLASIFGSIFQRYKLVLQIAGGLVIIFLGLCMIFELLEQKIHAIIPGRGITSTGIFKNVHGTGTAGGLLLGFSLGIVWTPCIGPLLGTILTMVAVEGDIVYGAFLLLIYSLGMGLPLLAIAYTSHFSLKPFQKYSMAIKSFSGIILVLVGIYFIYNSITIYGF